VWEICHRPCLACATPHVSPDADCCFAGTPLLSHLWLGVTLSPRGALRGVALRKPDDGEEGGGYALLATLETVFTGQPLYPAFA
jgi:hypothetical protein